MKNSKSIATGTGSRAAKSSGGSNKPTSSRPGGHGGPHTKQSSQRTASSTPSSSKAQSKVQSKPDKVAFSGSAKKQLSGLGLNEKHRQEVESWHTRTVQREMNHIGADHAKIRYLAHTEGSNDGKPHVTASLKSKDGNTIKNHHGNLSHLYYDGKRVPTVYTSAVQRKDGPSSS